MVDARPPACSRRTLLRALGVSSIAATAGCSSVLGDGGQSVRVLCAGSLQHAFQSLESAVDHTVEIEAHGSAAAARLVAEGSRDPDALALADPVLFESVLNTWYARIATTELVVAYDAATEAGQQVERADRWFDPVLDGSASLGRTDPDLDPLGYRTLFALELAADHYDRPNLPAAIGERSRVYPETSLLARLGTGAVDAAVVYRPMARDHGLATRTLPAAIDLGDPDHTEDYRTVSYELPDGSTVRGRPIDYAVTARTVDTSTRDVFEVIVDGELFTDHGFRTPDRYPAFEGDVPDRIQQ